MNDHERIAVRRSAAKTLVMLREKLAIKPSDYRNVIELHAECSGTGMVGGQACLYCNGSGRIRRITVSVEIPFNGRS